MKLSKWEILPVKKVFPTSPMLSEITVSKIFFPKKDFFQLVLVDSWGVQETLSKEWKFKSFDLAEKEMLQQMYQGFITYKTGGGMGVYTCISYILGKKGIVKRMDMDDFVKIMKSKTN